MNFDFNILAKSVPGICIVGGIALVIISELAGLGLTALGVLLIIAGIALQVYYIYSRYHR
jgi:hypothetical protein